MLLGVVIMCVHCCVCVCVCAAVCCECMGDPARCCGGGGVVCYVCVVVWCRICYVVRCGVCVVYVACAMLHTEKRTYTTQYRNQTQKNNSNTAFEKNATFHKPQQKTEHTTQYPHTTENISQTKHNMPVQCHLKVVCPCFPNAMPTGESQKHVISESHHQPPECSANPSLMGACQRHQVTNLFPVFCAAGGSRLKCHTISGHVSEQRYS